MENLNTSKSLNPDSDNNWEEVIDFSKIKKEGVIVDDLLTALN